MVRIRLRRVGTRHQPHYRIVVADQRAPRDGRFIEAIGYYNPRTEPETVSYDKTRAVYWLSQGGQPSKAVKRWFRRDGVYEALARHRSGTPLEELFPPEAEVEEEEPAEEEIIEDVAVAPAIDEIEEDEAATVTVEEQQPEVEAVEATDADVVEAEDTEDTIQAAEGATEPAEEEAEEEVTA